MCGKTYQGDPKCNCQWYKIIHSGQNVSRWFKVQLLTGDRGLGAKMYQSLPSVNWQGDQDHISVETCQGESKSRSSRLLQLRPNVVSSATVNAIKIFKARTCQGATTDRTWRLSETKNIKTFQVPTGKTIEIIKTQTYRDSLMCISQ